MRAGAAAPSARLWSLDWFNFIVANIQTGFGAFVAVYLTSEAWTQGEIGLALGIGTIATIASQLPAGAMVDALHNKRLAAAAACLAIAASALMIGLWPVQLSVWAAKILHGFASSMLTPTIAAISLALVGRAALGERLGRNSRYAAIGSGVAAAVMGAFGTYVSEASVFYLTAALMLPALLVLRAVPPAPAVRPGEMAASGEVVAQDAMREVLGLLASRRLLVFSVVVMLFHLSNAAQLPLIAGEVTVQAGSYASMVIAACIVLPQLLVAMLAPGVGRWAELYGRRRVMVVTFLAVPLRAALLATAGSPEIVVLVQVLDGISAAGFGVLLPLVAADITRGTGRFNLCLGLFGLLAALGATFSTILGGAIADWSSTSHALLVLAGFGVAAVLTAAVAMPETREA
ncbi:MAG: MFS transporter [Acetobacteraceae bacterium]|nr:MFS transporter [Acetobacteraceae bacterium]